MDLLKQNTGQRQGFRRSSRSSIRRNYLGYWSWVVGRANGVAGEVRESRSVEKETQLQLVDWQAADSAGAANLDVTVAVPFSIPVGVFAGHQSLGEAGVDGAISKDNELAWSMKAIKAQSC